MPTVRLFAAAGAAAGGTSQVVLPTASTVGQVIAQLADRYGPVMAGVLDRCAFAVDGTITTGAPRDAVVPVGATVDVLPPFAGG